QEGNPARVPLNQGGVGGTLLGSPFNMDILIQQVVSGLATGGIYGSVALALVMIYEATDIVNFAQGQMAVVSTYIAWSLLNFGAHDVGALAITVLVLVALYAFFRFTTLGLAMRAAAQNPASSRLCGIRVGWMLAIGWGLASLIGAVAGMMVAPIVTLDPNMMAGILIYAFASATLGGFTSPG